MRGINYLEDVYKCEPPKELKKNKVRRRLVVGLQQ